MSGEQDREVLEERLLFGWKVQSYIPWPSLADQTARRMIKQTLDAILASDWLADLIRRERASILDAVEARIRGQAEAAPMLSMEWRAHMADIAHLSEVRRENGIGEGG